MAKASLLVIHGPEQGARFELGDQPVTLGRAMQCSVRILDTEVSRLHASIVPAETGFLLTDRNSANGTFVNGAAVRTYELLHGDQIQIGRTVLLFEDHQAEQPPPSNDLITILQKHDPTDRSSIVSQVPSNVDQELPVIRPTQAAGYSNFAVLYRIAEEAVRPSIPIGQLLQRILDLTIEVVGADRGCILLIEPDTQEWQLQAVSRRGSQAGAGGMPVSRSIVDYVLKVNQGVRTTDARHDQRFDPAQSILQAGIVEAMCVPLQGRLALDGVIYVDTTTPADQVLARPSAGSRFREDQLRLLVAIGRQAALAVENNRYQQAIVKAERLAAMGQTIATLSHHIKNILQGVRGGSYLIDLGLNDHNEEMVRKGWQIVEKNQGKIYHLVMDMLTFSKERQPAWQEASVNQTVADVVELIQPRAEESHVTLEFTPAPDLPETTFDPEGIHRAVLNVVINAIDAVEGRENARVVIKTGFLAETQMICVSVEDNGPGISDEQMKKLFSLFESTKGARGTGLGLAVSQKILREHGGEITVESRLGQGARFTLAWPRSEEDHQLGSRTQA